MLPVPILTWNVGFDLLVVDPVQSISLSQNYVLPNMSIWNESGEVNARWVQVCDGQVEKILKKDEFNENENSLPILNEFAGKTLIPAGVDAQVHLRVPGQPEKEEARTGLSAAVCGGVGAFLSMPNTRPALDSVSVLQKALEEVRPFEDSIGVKVLFTACLTRSMAGNEAVDYESLIKEGVVHFTDDGLGVESDSVMESIFRESDRLGFKILQHAEMPGHGGVLAPGPVQKKLGVKPYLDNPEVDMVDRDIKLLRKYPKAHYHVLHISSLRTLELIERAKADGLNISGEVTPHHLLYSCDDIREKDSSFKMNPPIRTKKDRDALRGALQSGLLDFVATDHAPHESLQKGENFAIAAFGTTGLEASLRVLLKLRSDGALSTSRLVSSFSSAPARFLGIESEYGSIEVGKKLNVVIVDTISPYTPILTEELASKSHNSCFLAESFPGKIEATILGTLAWRPV